MAKIVRPKPIPKGVWVVRYDFPEDGEAVEFDALEVAAILGRQQTKLLQMKREEAAIGKERRGANARAATAVVNERNEMRDLLIWVDAIDLLILALTDRPQLESVLSETYTLRDHKLVVPRVKWPTFKPSNIPAALARKYGVSIPTVKSIMPATTTGAASSPSRRSTTAAPA